MSLRKLKDFGKFRKCNVQFCQMVTNDFFLIFVQNNRNNILVKLEGDRITPQFSPINGRIEANGLYDVLRTTLKFPSAKLAGSCRIKAFIIPYRKDFNIFISY